MENNVTFPQWKLIFQKANLKNFTLLGIFGSIIVVLIIFTADSCGVRHILILNEITSYEKSFEPELCEVVVEKIDSFNDRCEPQITILDCG